MSANRLTSHQIVERLQRDLLNTLGDPHAALVDGVAADVHELGLANDGDKIVGDVQQYLHDTRENATWPACPRHHRHPLWYRAGSWWCVEDGEAIAPLGELSASGAARR